MAQSQINPVAVLWFIVASGSVVVSGNFNCPLPCECPDVTTVNCQNGFLLTSIPQLPEQTEQFTLEGARLGELSLNAFTGATKLTHLYLRSDGIQRISSQAFSVLTNLKVLNIYKNAISHLHSEAFKPLVSLEFLSIKNSFLTNLPVGALCHMVNLKVLDLRNNNLSNVTFNCFTKFDRIMKLVLSDNHLQSLSSESFKGLEGGSLRELYLSNCKIGKMVNPDLFTYVNSVNKLDLSSNRLSHLPPTLFESMKYLKHLVISKNPLKTIPQASLCLVPKLEELYLDQIGLTTFEHFEVFRNLTRLNTLSFDSNTFGALKNDSFRYLDHAQIETLSLRKCSLKYIESGTFWPLKHLIKIHIDGNPLTIPAITNMLMSLPIYNISILSLVSSNIQSINSSTFSTFRLGQLTELDLSHSNIPTIGASSFTVFTHLKRLYAARNSIVTLQDKCFHGLSQLQKLDLSHNKLIQIPSPLSTGVTGTLRVLILTSNKIDRIDNGALHGYNSLESLKLDANDVSFIAKDAFAHFETLKYLNLANNRLASLKNSQFAPLTSLVELDLQSNNIQFLSSDIFATLTALRRLNLNSNNHLGNVLSDTPEIFSNLTSLQYLNLRLCGVTSIPLKLFSRLQCLNTLILSGNLISSWTSGTFSELTNLTRLEIAQNNIVVLNKNSFDSLTSLRKLDLSKNLFTCNCDMVGFQSWLKTSNIYMINLAGNSSYMCHAPADMVGTPLLQFRLSIADCKSFATIWILTACGSCVVLFMIVGTVVYRYRWYLRYWCYLARARRRQYKEVRNQEVYTNDAFIAYNSKDRHWVIQQMLPEMEKRRGFKLWLHDRDWLAGPDIHDNIIDSIENSRKTVIILSNNFARSQWCQLELTMAQHKLFEGNRSVVVLVLLEEIESRNLSNQLRYLLTTKTYLPWPDQPNDKDVKKFWGALSASLTSHAQTEAIPL